MPTSLRLRASLSFFGAVLLLSAVAYAGGPYVYYSVTPCRLVDTRDPAGLTGGPALAHGVVRSFPIYGASARQCGIPSTAKVAALNLTVVTPTNGGHLVLFPYNTPIPPTSTINFALGETALGNGAIAALTVDPNLHVSVLPVVGGGGTVHLVIDITGYYQEP